MRKSFSDYFILPIKNSDEPFLNSKFDKNRQWLDENNNEEWTPSEEDLTQIEEDAAISAAYEN